MRAMLQIWFYQNFFLYCRNFFCYYWNFYRYFLLTRLENDYLETYVHLCKLFNLKLIFSQGRDFSQQLFQYYVIKGLSCSNLLNTCSNNEFSYSCHGSACSIRIHCTAKWLPSIKSGAVDWTSSWFHFSCWTFLYNWTEIEEAAYSSRGCCCSTWTTQVHRSPELNIKAGLIYFAVSKLLCKLPFNNKMCIS